jgi:hypothetical protein
MMSAVALIALIIACWNIVPGLLAGRRALRFLPLLAWSLAGVFAAAGEFRRALLSGHQEDSLFTLRPLEQLGVVALAALMMLAAGWLAYRAACRLARLTRSPSAHAAGLAANLALTLALYALGWMLAPQIFYAYYQMIIPGLPSQWVIRGAEQVGEFADAVRLLGDGSLASHAAGAFFWVLFGLTMAVHAIVRRSGNNG